MWCVHWEFSYESTGEWMLTLGPHLPKLSNIKWLTFLRTQYSLSDLECLFRTTQGQSRKRSTVNSDCVKTIVYRYICKVTVGQLLWLFYDISVWYRASYGFSVRVVVVVYVCTQCAVFTGGYYHGKLVFPREFPFKPPSIYMLTPSGRFSVNTRCWFLFCFNSVRYHCRVGNEINI